MIARLRGRPVGRGPDGLVLDVNGVGYLVAATPSVLRRAGASEVTIRHTRHRLERWTVPRRTRSPLEQGRPATECVDLRDARGDALTRILQPAQCHNRFVAARDEDAPREERTPTDAVLTVNVDAVLALDARAHPFDTAIEHLRRDRIEIVRR